MERQVLITGGAGSIGAPLARRLLAEGSFHVTVLDAFDPEEPRATKEDRLRGSSEHPRFRLVEGDLLEPSTEARVFAQGSFDVVVHLATKRDASDPLRQHRVNVGGTLQVLEWMRGRGIARLVMGSTTDAAGTVPGARAIARTAADLHATGAIAMEEFARVHARLHGASIQVVRLAPGVSLTRPADAIDALFAACSSDPVPGFGIVEVPSR